MIKTKLKQWIVFITQASEVARKKSAKWPIYITHELIILDIKKYILIHILTVYKFIYKALCKLKTT